MIHLLLALSQVRESPSLGLPALTLARLFNRSCVSIATDERLGFCLIKAALVGSTTDQSLCTDDPPPPVELIVNPSASAAVNVILVPAVIVILSAVPREGTKSH